MTHFLFAIDRIINELNGLFKKLVICKANSIQCLIIETEKIRPIVDSTDFDELLWSWTLWFDVAKSIIVIHNSDDIFRFLNDKIYLLVFFLGDIYSHLDSLDYIPNITPESFLSEQSWIKLNLGFAEIIISQPSSSFFVYFLSLSYIYVGLKFYRNQNNQRSRYWWALGFLLTGFAAILAGTSYQAFGFEIKCKGRHFCRWTSWWEIIYEILQGAGINAFLIATAYSNTRGKLKTLLIYYAIANAVTYTTVVMYGALVLKRTFITFELLEFSALPSILFFLCISIYGYLKCKDPMNLHLMNTWIILITIIITYNIFSVLNIGQSLWYIGIWFPDNDVLHVGLIFFVIYVTRKLPKEVKDLEESKSSYINF